MRNNKMLRVALAAAAGVGLMASSSAFAYNGGWLHCKPSESSPQILTSSGNQSFEFQTVYVQNTKDFTVKSSKFGQETVIGSGGSVNLRYATVRFCPGASLVFQPGAQLNTDHVVFVSDNDVDNNEPATSSVRSHFKDFNGFGVVLLGNARVNDNGSPIGHLGDNTPRLSYLEGTYAYGGDPAVEFNSCAHLADTTFVNLGDYNKGASALVLAGCGRGTTLNHVSSINSGDDGIKFFGGKGGLYTALDILTPGHDGLDWSQGTQITFFDVHVASAGFQGIEGHLYKGSASFEACTGFGKHDDSQVQFIRAVSNSPFSNVAFINKCDANDGAVTSFKFFTDIPGDLLFSSKKK